MRVYEFSKKNNIPTKDLLEILEQGGFAIHSHMSVLPQDAIDFLTKKFNKDTSVNVEKSVPIKQTTKTSSMPATQEIIDKKQEAPAIREAEKDAPKRTGTFSSPVAPVPAPEKKAALGGEKEEAVVQEEAIFFVEPMLVGSFAEKIKKPVAEVIVVLLKWGVVAAKNQLLSEGSVEKLARHFDIAITTKPKDIARETEVHRDALIAAQVDENTATNRAPVVVVLGHVDHGKTTLLDFIRKTRVTSREKGGITQHLGAYEATTPQGNIVFIDTPGHEAFSKMRMRGIKVADVVILVVAADDSVMPQTIEAIKQAKSMHVPIIVAINKMDRVDKARIEVVRRDLANHGLLSEEWGGDVVLVPVSAKTGQGVDHLLEMIVLQSQMMDLKAPLSGKAKGYVLEAKLEKGRGSVVTLLCQRGVLKVGDYFACGTTGGKVTSLTNSQGQRLQEVNPGVPVLVAGFLELPNAGDSFEAISQAEYKDLARTRFVTEHKSMATTSLSATGATINILFKADTNSSREAVLESIAKLSKKLEKKFNVIVAGVGEVTESDVEFAATTKSTIYTLHVKTEPNALILAHRLGVAIHHYDIIYKLLEALDAVAQGAKEIKKIKTKIGDAVVRQVFNIKGVGVIGGSYVTDGRFSKDGSVVIMRGRKKIGQGAIKSLQRDKKSVKEVHAGYECGFLVDGFNEWEVDDKVECYLDLPEQTKK